MDFASAYDPLRALQVAAKLLGRAVLPLLVGGTILFLCGGFEYGGGNLLHGFDLLSGPLAFLTSCCCCFGFGLFFLRTWLTIGFANTVGDVARTGRGDLATLFEARGRFVDLLVARFLVFLVGVAGLIPLACLYAGTAVTCELTEIPEPLVVLGALFGTLLYLPFYLYVLLGFSFVVPAVAIDGRAGADAFTHSWQLAHGRRLRLFVYFLVLCVVEFAGLLVCFVGVLGTSTLCRIGVFESYLAWTRGEDYRSWWVTTGAAPAPSVPATPAPAPGTAV